MGGWTVAGIRECSPFELASWWSDRWQWPAPGEHDATSRVRELAVIAALDEWLRRWLPGMVHRAALAGASVDDIAAATGLTVTGVWVEWTQWAVAQRALYEDTEPGRAPIGLSADEYERARAVFTARVTGAG